MSQEITSQATDAPRANALSMSLGVTSLAAVPNAPRATTSFQAYSENSVAAGGTVSFRVSGPISSPAYSLSIVRLGCLTPQDTATKDWTYAVVASDATAPQQVVRPGSYIHVEAALPSATSIPAITLECWVRPFYGAPRHWMGLISQHTYGGSCGYGIFITDQGIPACYFGDGGPFNASCLFYGTEAAKSKFWSHVVAVFDGAAGTVAMYLNGQPTGGPYPSIISHVTAGTSPLRLGAYGDSSGTNNFLDGDLAMPIIYSRALSASEVEARYTQVMGTVPHSPHSPPAPGSGNVEGCWPLTEEIGQQVHDVSGLGRTGTIVNRGTWMIGGPSFDASAVLRFPDSPYVPMSDPTRGHALRLSQTDLYDCGWSSTHSFSIPLDTPSGIYAGRFTWTSGSSTQTYDVPFVIRPAAEKPPAPIGVLVATNTWHAYQTDTDPVRWIEGWTSTKPFILPDFYNSHSGGQPTYMVGINMPLPGADKSTSPTDEWYYGPLLRAERPLHAWLDQNNYDYDAFSDLDLHLNGLALLSKHRVVFIVGHSEYWTREAYNALQAYIDGGGQVICASGNTMFWRISVDNAAAPQVIQCRKLPSTVGGQTDSPGEIYHEGDQQRGGLMREASDSKAPTGYPAWQVLGLDSIGYIGGPGYGGDFVASKVYGVSSPSHAFFNAPEVTNAVVGSSLGGIAVGHEFDASISTIATLGNFSGRLPSPPPVVLARGLGAGTEGQLDHQGRFDYQCNWSDAMGTVINETIDWVRPSGGRVFNTGSIATAISLITDPLVAPGGIAGPPASGLVGMVFRNALHQMGVKSRLTACAVTSAGHLVMSTFDGFRFGPILDLGGGLSSPPTGVLWAPNNLNVMAYTTAGHLQYHYFDASSGTPILEGVEDQGNTFIGRPAVVAWGRNRLNIFARGNNGHLYEKKWNGGWSGWNDLGGGVAADPAAVVQEGRRISLAVLLTSGNISYRYSINDAWSDWQDMGGAGSFKQAPTLLAWNGNWVSVFGVRLDGTVAYKWWDGSNWNPSLTTWQTIGAPSAIVTRVAVAASGQQLTVFGTNSSHRVVATSGNASGWAAFSDGGLNSALEPAAATFRGGSMSIMAIGTDSRLYQNVWIPTSVPGQGGWSGWNIPSPFSNCYLAGSPAIFSWVSS